MIGLSLKDENISSPCCRIVCTQTLLCTKDQSTFVFVIGLERSVDLRSHHLRLGKHLTREQGIALRLELLMLRNSTRWPWWNFWMQNHKFDFFNLFCMFRSAMKQILTRVLRHVPKRFYLNLSFGKVDTGLGAITKSQVSV